MKEERRKKKNAEVRVLYERATKVCSSFFDEEYHYDATEAVEELGLDEELIHQLLEDYINQIIKAIMAFEEMLYVLQSRVDAKLEIDYTELRNLAHKNLGVARNLRIKDAETLLNKMMKEDDLESLFLFIEALRACAIKLNPEFTFNAIKLIEIKSTF